EGVRSRGVALAGLCADGTRAGWALPAACQGCPIARNCAAGPTNSGGNGGKRGTSSRSRRRLRRRRSGERWPLASARCLFGEERRRGKQQQQQQRRPTGNTVGVRAGDHR
ncbi:unnamed protein product, partial [Ectocarpus sp. 12 AP-2014]